MWISRFYCFILWSGNYCFCNEFFFFVPFYLGVHLRLINFHEIRHVDKFTFFSRLLLRARPRHSYKICYSLQSLPLLKLILFFETVFHQLCRLAVKIYTHPPASFQATLNTERAISLVLCTRDAPFWRAGRCCMLSLRLLR
jgi:hypothetical protein